MAQDRSKRCPRQPQDDQWQVQERPWLSLAPGFSWLLLAPPGSSWLPLGLLLAPPGSSWLPGPPGAALGFTGSPGLSLALLAPPGSSWRLLGQRGAARRSQHQPGGARRSQEEPAGSRSSQEARRSQEELSWLPLASPGFPGCCWLLLAPPGSSWLLLAPLGPSGLAQIGCHGSRCLRVTKQRKNATGQEDTLPPKKAPSHAEMLLFVGASRGLWAQDRPKIAQDRSKRGPRQPQDGPRLVQERPKTAPRLPQVSRKYNSKYNSNITQNTAK